MVRVLNADAAPMPLRFDTLERALAYTMTVPPDVAPGGGVGRLTSGSRRTRPRLIASRLPGQDRHMSSGSRDGAIRSAARSGRPADPGPLLEGRAGVTRAAPDKVRRAAR